MRKMKKGVVAQLIYMLVLIAIAVVVGLFFMTVVEKNKKQTTDVALNEYAFEAVFVDKTNGVVRILANKDPSVDGYEYAGCNTSSLKKVYWTPSGAGYMADVVDTSCKGANLVYIGNSNTSAKFSVYIR
jgi:hypothetical protein